jgi:formylglycine-generating enzyme required for sulfatase activity
VVDVTWYDTLRFANWLSNGQGNGDTETGSYTLLGGTPTPSNASSISRNPGAQFFLPSENEWYKAAYYDPTLNSGSGGYWQYPTKSNTAPTSQAPAGGTNSANFCDNTTGFALTGSTAWNPSFDYLTDVGAFASSTSFYGTFDQGGDVFQWNESLSDFSSFGFRGGSWNYNADYMASSSPGFPSGADYYLGFRIAGLPVPEPGSLTLLVCGGLCLLAYAWRRRRKLPNLIPTILATIVVLAADSVQADVFNMPASQTSLQFVTVGDPGNAPDPATGDVYGSVAQAFQMGKYDVTVGQYCQFLNAVAATDTYSL